MFVKKIFNYGVRKLFLVIVLKTIGYFRIFFYRHLLSDNHPKLSDAKLNQAVQFVGKGQINIGSTVIGVWPSPYLLSDTCYIEARSLGAEVSIGNGTSLSNGATVIADKTKVVIGDRCLIGARLFICDSDFHGLDLESRTNGIYQCSPVTVGDDVFIGQDVKILKGVSIGDGAVIGSGSIVTKDVENHSIYAGNPARFIRSLKP